MKVLAQPGLLGIAVATAWQHSMHLVLQLLAGNRVCLSYAALALLICLPACAGTLIAYRLRARSGASQKRNQASIDELAMLRAVAANLPDPIYVKDSKSRFLLANRAAAINMGATCEGDLLGKTDFDFFPESLARSFFEDEQNVILSGQPQVSKEETLEDPNGQVRFMLSTKVPVFDADGKSVGIVGVGRNITGLKAVEAELRRSQQELKFKATHDCLTSLLNREAILDMLDRELARGARENNRTVVLLGDLDHFKNINDFYGHPIGDEVLREAAQRLRTTVRAYDLVGRYGGEEFLIVLPGCAAADALARANQLRENIAASPIPTARGPLPITISIGVLAAEEWGNPSTTEILREVDNALYAAKAAGRNRCRMALPSQPAHTLLNPQPE